MSNDQERSYQDGRDGKVYDGGSLVDFSRGQNDRQAWNNNAQGGTGAPKRMNTPSTAPGGYDGLGQIGLLLILAPLALASVIAALPAALLLLLVIGLLGARARPDYHMAFKTAFFALLVLLFCKLLVLVPAIALGINAPDVEPELVQAVVGVEAELIALPGFGNGASALFGRGSDDTLDHINARTWWLAVGLLWLPGILLAARVVHRRFADHLEAPARYGKALLLTLAAIVPALVGMIWLVAWAAFQRYNQVLEGMNNELLLLQ